MHSSINPIVVPNHPFYVGRPVHVKDLLRNISKCWPMVADRAVPRFDASPRYHKARTLTYLTLSSFICTDNGGALTSCRGEEQGFHALCIGSSPLHARHGCLNALPIRFVTVRSLKDQDQTSRQPTMYNSMLCTEQDIVFTSPERLTASSPPTCPSSSHLPILQSLPTESWTQTALLLTRTEDRLMSRTRRY